MNLSKKNGKVKIALFILCGALIFTGCADQGANDQAEGENAEVSQQEDQASQEEEKDKESEEDKASEEDKESEEDKDSDEKDSDKKETEEKSPEEKAKEEEEEKAKIAEYESYAKDFEKLTISEIQEKIEAKEPFLLYTGRSTCITCREVLPVVHDLLQKNGVKGYYLDCDASRDDEQFDSFLDELNVETIPDIAIFDKDGNHQQFEFNVNEPNITKKLLNAMFEAGIPVNQRG